MATKCQVCHSPHRQLIEKLAAGGASLDQLKTEMKERGIKLPTITLKRHLKTHADIPLEQLHPSILNVMKSPEERAVEAQADRDRQLEADAVLQTMIEADSVSLTEFMGEIGLKADPETVDDVIAADQTISYRMFLKMAAVLDKATDLHMRDRERHSFPVKEIKALQTAHEMLSVAFAYREAVNINAATRAIHREGGRVLFEAVDVAETETDNELQK